MAPGPPTPSLTTAATERRGVTSTAIHRKGRRILKEPADAVQATIATVGAIVRGDQAAILGAVDSSEALSTQDVLSGLGHLGQLIFRRSARSDREFMRAELEAADGPPEVIAAVREIGNLLLVDADLAAAHAAIVAHAGWLEGSADDLWAAAVGELLFAAARIIQRLRIDISLLRNDAYLEPPGL
jgi:hypothetical protein